MVTKVMLWKEMYYLFIIVFFLFLRIRYEFGKEGDGFIVFFSDKNNKCLLFLNN